MPVIPSQFHLLDYTKILKELIFLSSQKNVNNSHQNPDIISFSFNIDPLDSLIFFSVMKEENQLSFYWENQRKQESIVAISALKSLTINHSLKEDDNRFSLCQKFITETRQKLANDQAYFFSYFSFFNSYHNLSHSFPLATIFLPAIQLLKKDNIYTLTINTYNNPENINLIKQYINNNFSQKIISSYQNFTEEKNTLHYSLAEDQYQSFIDKVNLGLEAIHTKKLTKIVVAHSLEVKTNKNFNIIKSLNNLRKNYPDCYVFSISNQNQEHFIGASPERLLSIKDNTIISDALAGSAPRGKNEEDDNYIGNKLLDSEKEKREHQIVSDFIFNQLLTMGLSPRKSTLKLLKLSNIQHLWTPINAQINTDLNPLEIIEKLHPTPAVAGIPTDIACTEIQALEKFDRALYSAPIGWLNRQGNCEFVVGIRSALIKGNYARLFAGAGIVEGSKPEQELIEIKLKFQALLQALI
ncbi:isochorismate synthase [Geminocystis herdmanii]|uniref:isochorismate synthase n=1 Tax=Geminocystis herdmanii TaxID=669359 RepID=UPI0003463BA3|nr:isochorismate synthase [Geminocystis herdmanii]